MFRVSPTRSVILVLALLLLCGQSVAFQLKKAKTISRASQVPVQSAGGSTGHCYQYASSALQMSNGGSGNDSKGPLSRIISPKIDDRGLPLTDVFTAQIIGPSLQVFWLTFNRAPRPSWLQPIFDNTFYQYRGALLAPTLIHGAGLACCWLLGALFARAYEEEAVDPTVAGYSTVLWRIFQAGCFASGVLIFATQVDLLFEFGRYVQLGESQDIDVRLLSAYIEIINDIVFEVLTIVPIRLYLAATISKNKSD